VNDQDAWIARNAAQARRALADPAVRAALLGLLGTDDGGRRRARRLEAARRELEGLEARWPLLEENEHEP
jgi:hypothetical protein